MPLVRTVEPAIHDIVVVVAVRNPEMPAVLTMSMVADLVGTSLRVGLRHRDRVVVDVVAVNVMQVSVVEVVHVRGVTNGGMSTAWRVYVAVLPMRAVRRARAANQHATDSKQQQVASPIAPCSSLLQTALTC